MTLALLFRAPEPVDEVVTWYRKHYSELGEVDVFGQRDAEPDALRSPVKVRVRPPGWERGRQPLPFPVAYVKPAPTAAPNPELDWLRVFFRGEAYEGPELETKILLQGSFPEPASARLQRATASERERLASAWRRAKVELLTKEVTLDGALQYSGAMLVGTAVEDGRQTGYVTVRLSFSCSEEAPVVLGHFRTVLSRLGEVVRPAGEEEGPEGGGLELRQGGPYISTLSVQPAETGAVGDRKTPRAQAAPEARTRYTWALQRRAPWLAWAVDVSAE